MSRFAKEVIYQLRKRCQNTAKAEANEAALGRAPRLRDMATSLVVSEIIRQMNMMLELGIFLLLRAKVQVGLLKNILV